MKFILILISFICLIPNFNPPQDLTNIGIPRIIIEWGVTLVLSYTIIIRMLRGYSSSFKHRVYCLWLVWMILSQIVLAYCWTPDLSHTQAHWGFDPQRYYYYMSHYIQYGDWGEMALNYNGVLYFYLPFLMIMGLHPLIPVFVNGIILLISSLLIIKLFDEQFEKRYLVLLILFPELILFGVMTSKEIPCAFALIVALYGYLKYMPSKSQRYIPAMLFGVALMGMIRLPYVFALFMAICVYAFFYTKQKWLVYISAGVFLLAGIYLSAAIGSDVNQADLAASLSDKVIGNNQAWSSGYTNNSIARFLIPHNPIQFVLYGIIRSFCYLFPQPSMFTGQLSSSYSIGSLCTIGLASILMYLAIPFVFSYIKRTIKNRDGSLAMEQMFVVAFLVFWLFIGVSTVEMIHIRYRAVYDLVYITILIMYFKDTPKTTYLPLFYKWCVVSVALFIMYFVIKTLL